MINVATNLLENGGFTYNIKDGSFASDGFAVAVYNDKEYIFEAADEYEALAGIVQYTANNMQTLLEKNVFLGGWVDDGNVYLDCSVVLQDKNEAIELGKTHKQLAIFDLSTFEEIRL